MKDAREARADSSSTRRRAAGFVLLFAAFMIPAGLAMLAGTGTASAGSPPVTRLDAQTALEAAGQVLYEEHCASCHGATGEGTAQGPVILDLGPAAYDFMMSTGRMPLSQPGAQAVRKPPVLSPAEIKAITAYLVSLSPGSGTAIPNVQPLFGNLSDGEQVYQLNCAPCHGANGNGGAVGVQAAPSLHLATPTQIGEAVRIGPGTMPVFDPTVISDQQLNSLARYVLYLRHPDNPGGISLHLGGPVVEGFVGLVIGLGAVVLVMRFIGERS
ncbi:MAG TPA: c-type cytochrome [Actinomycetota bacterium]|nr:c-type cytochrome [Actinomycetota bacterium]